MGPQSEPTIFLVACAVSLALTGLIREIAPRIGLTDNPDGRRKLHGRAIPLGGGLAVFVTTAVILGSLWIIPSGNDAAVAAPDAAERVEESGESSDAAPAEADSDAPEAVYTDVRTKLRVGCPNLPALLLAGLVIVIVGLIDDCKGLPGKQKLVGQMVAVAILLLDGLLIRRIELFGSCIDLWWFAYPVTLLWLLGAINSLNLLDGIDGLAAMLGIILSCTIAAMSVVTGNHGVAIIAMVFAASLLGFLRFNFPPASIFLGDTGSMLIGLVVGALAIQGSLKGAGTVLLAAPLAVWTLPFFDSFAAILRRKLTGQSIYATDRGHLHHRMLALLGSNRKVLGWLALCCAILSFATLVGLVLRDDRITVLTCLSVVLIFIATGVFGRVELMLVGTQLRNVGRRLVAPIIWRGPRAWQTSVRLQGSREWDLLWTTFIESADKLSLTDVRLDVNLPTAHEAYHAAWERPRRSKTEFSWRVEVPLVMGGFPVGRIRIAGERNGQSACLDIQQLMELIEPFESRLCTLADWRQLRPDSDGQGESLPDTRGKNHGAGYVAGGGHAPRPHVSEGPPIP
ncbi:MAG: undecaprenyl/decaprenyl-phosphate alpha-N-acetylglucosaminyl 1-phosphate transferase [Pirellulales bacterium]|nr:undecaprenyl/decaprenyl-phosphate alpha-N-acetylglucosaminyl 1-phosphate transferase [Pirellulales bacterium]